MKMKVNCSMLAETEQELRILSLRMRAIMEELSGAQRALLSFGNTFRYEAALIGKRREKLEREAQQLNGLAQALERLTELYASCERQRWFRAAFAGLPIRADLIRLAGDAAYYSAEQMSGAYEELIKPLIGRP